jgi:hypothetical protein
MNNEIRLLDPSNENDQRMLSDVLDHLLNYEKHAVSRERTLEQWERTINFVKSKFNLENKNEIYITGNIVNNEIIDLSAGCKWMLFNKVNLRPEWIHIIVYSRDKNIRSPMNKIRETGATTVQRFEKDRYYHFWQCMRFPNLKTNKECQSYIDDHFDKKIDMHRYINILEYVHFKGKSFDSIPRFFTKFFEGTTGNKNMCLTSHHLRAEYRTFVD